MDTARILLVEDDDGIASPLVSALQGQGYAVMRVATGAAALAACDAADLVVLDLGLPDLDGLEVCRRIRRSRGPDLPILMLTARAGEMDTVVGLDAGADDYVAKPFRLAELSARVRALLRRAATSDVEATLTAQDVTVDSAARRASVGGRELDLTPTEFDLLAALLRRAGAVVRRDDLVRDIWSTGWSGASRTLDVHVSGLRRKLGDDPAAARYLTTVRGVGFRFEVERTAS